MTARVLWAAAAVTAVHVVWPSWEEEGREGRTLHPG